MYYALDVIIIDDDADDAVDMASPEACWRGVSAQSHVICPCQAPNPRALKRWKAAHWNCLIWKMHSLHHSTRLDIRFISHCIRSTICIELLNTSWASSTTSASEP